MNLLVLFAILPFLGTYYYTHILLSISVTTSTATTTTTTTNNNVNNNGDSKRYEAKRYYFKHTSLEKHA